MVSNWQKQLRNDVKLLLFLELNKLGQNNDKIDILEDVITSSEATADNDKQIKVSKENQNSLKLAQFKVSFEEKLYPKWQKYDNKSKLNSASHYYSCRLCIASTYPLS